MIFILILLSSMLFSVSSFNLDTDIPVLKLGKPGTYFGYSVAQHLRGDTPTILVGAPRDESGQVGTSQAGAVYSCPVNSVPSEGSASRRNPWCLKEKVEYIIQGDPDDPAGVVEDPYQSPPESAAGRNLYENGKNHQLLGSVVSSAGTSDSRVVVCAPLLRFRSVSYTDGTCYVLDNDLQQTSSIHTCDTLVDNARHNRYGACLEGFSAIYDQRLAMVATGSPGAWKWTGGVSARNFAGGEIGIISQRWTMGQMGIDSVQKGLDSHDYLGFSVGMGRFGFSHESGERNSPSGNLTVVSGASRRSDIGGVFFMPFSTSFISSRSSNELNSLRLLGEKQGRDFLAYNLTGEKLMSAFGYTLVVMDINNDGFDDLLVGAPFHYETINEASEVYGGAVFVYFSKGKDRELDSDDVFSEPVRLLGPADSQFGLSLANVGDLNKDGFLDFAVGAPYTDGGGTVFIFHGAAASSSFDKEPSQIIKGRNLNTGSVNKALNTFGWSLSGGTDLDGNRYPDLLVGAYASDVAVLLRAKPIIHVSAEVVKSDLKQIDKDASDCWDWDSWAQACFSFRTRLSVSRAEESDLDLSRNIFECKLEVLPFQEGVGARGHIESRDRTVKRWDCGREADRRPQTDTHRIAVARSNKDWLNPLKLKFSVDLKDKAKPSQPAEGERLPDVDRYPVLDKKGSSSLFTVPFNKKCGADNQCRSDLVVKCSLKDLYREDGIYVKQVGQSANDGDDTLDVQFEVKNTGERAYESMLYLSYDSEELERPELTHETGRLVNLVPSEEKNLVTVDMGNPFEQNNRVVFTLSFRLARGQSEGLGRALEFVAVANSTSDEIDPDNNECFAQVKVIKKAELSLTGQSDPSLVYYGGKVVGESAMEYEEDIGQRVVHQYQVTNFGPWSVSNVTVLVNWPYEVQSPFPQGKWALYMMEPPVASTPVPGQARQKIERCVVDRPVDRINPLGLNVNTRYSLNLPPTNQAVRIKREARPEDQPFVGRVGGSEEERKVLGRQTRELTIRPELVTEKETGQQVYAVTVSCAKRTAKCFQIRCHFAFLAKDMVGTVKVRARLWNSTFVEDYRNVDHVRVVSSARIVVDPKQGVEEADLEDNSAEAMTRAYPDIPKIEDKKAIPIWVIPVAVVVGLFLLILIVICCWMCGFFKRRKRSDHPHLYKAELHQTEDWTET